MKENQTNSQFRLSLAILICAIACGFFLLEAIIANSFDSLATIIKQQFSLNNYYYASLSSIYLTANLICLIPFGIALDRLPIKYVLSSAIGLSTIAAITIYLAANYISLLFGFLLAGIGGSVAFLSCITLNKHWLPQRYIALANGIVVASAMLGGIIAQSPLLLFIHHYSWQKFYLLIAFIETLLVLATLIFVKEHPSIMQQQIYRLKNLLTSCIKNRYNWLGGGYTSIMNLSVTLIGALFGQGLLISLYHVSPSSAAMITSLLFAGILLGSPLVGWLNNRLFQQKTLMLGGAITAAITLLLLLLSPIKTPITASLYFLLLGISSSTQVLGYTIVSNRNDTRTIGTAISLAGMIVMLGGAFFQPVLGWMLDRLHNNYQWMIYSLTLLFCLACVIVFWMYRNNELTHRNIL